MKRKLLIPVLTLGALGLGSMSLSQSLSTLTNPNQVLLTSSNINNKDSKNNIKIGYNRDYIIKELKANKTVSQIKTELCSNFKNQINSKVTAGKLSKSKASMLITKYNYHMSSANILNGIIKSHKVMIELNSGKTIKEIESSIISSMQTKINKNLNKKKITKEQATKIENRLTKSINSDNGLFENLNLIHTIQTDLNKGESIASIKSTLIKNKETKLNDLINSGQISKTKEAQLQSKIIKHIDNLSEFKHISTNHWVQKELNSNKSIDQIKTDYITKLTNRKNSINNNTNLSSAEKANAIKTINNLISKVQSGNIFTLTHSNK